MVCYSKKLFEKEYSVENLDLNYIFEESHGYIVQLDILEFPKNKNCFPVLELLDESGQLSTSNYESYTQKQIQQRVWLTEREKSDNQTIRIYSLMRNIYTVNTDKCGMFFKLTIFENVELQSSKPCNFPMYGINCDKALNQFDIDLLIEVTVKKQGWFQAYYKLGNLDYQLKITNPNKLMGVSLVLGSINNIAHLPSFFDNYILIKDKQTKTINLNSFFQVTDQANYYILIGIYNENNLADQQMIIEMNQIKAYVFPVWAVLSIALIVMIGVLIVFYIYYSYKKKYHEITYVKPVIEKAILDTYMPSLKMIKDYTKLECSICLIQFEMSDKYRITPCNHLFHDECLRDWTKKNGNCPLCRQGFKEEELKIFCEKLNSNINDSRAEIKKETTPTHFMKLSNSDITQNRSVNSPQHQVCQSESGRKTSVLVIQDEVIE